MKSHSSKSSPSPSPSPSSLVAASAASASSVASVASLAAATSATSVSTTTTSASTTSASAVALSSSLSSSEVGVYIHVPYCLQKCHYCDFVKYGVEELPPIEDYFKLVLEELKQLKLNKSQSVKSLYFGGGTPSLASKKDLKSIVDKVSTHFIQNPEITLEINPGTLTLKDFKELRSIGFNRFSIGVQTFNQKLLQSCGRQHTPMDSLKDLNILKSLKFNFSMDLLYGLPEQSLGELTKDLEIIKDLKPPHISSYNLTLAKGHRFDVNRPSDEIQIQMMELIEKKLLEFNCKKYEVSNFSQPGFESKHNQGYWKDQSYFSFGMGAHSYDRDFTPWGRRYWNTAHYDKYKKCIKSGKRLYQGQEVLKLHEALTDYLHTSLRQVDGLLKNNFLHKFNKFNFNEELLEKVNKKFLKLINNNLLSQTQNGWALTNEGFRKTNVVFLELCFSEKDLSTIQNTIQSTIQNTTQNTIQNTFEAQF